MDGIFGAALKEDCQEVLFYGTDYHSHLGTEYGGLAVLGKKLSRKIHTITGGQFKSRFYEDYKKMKGKSGIGVISTREEQPIYLNSKFGHLCIVSNGLITNSDSLTKDLHRQGISFSETAKQGINSTELIAKLINQGNSLVHGIENYFKRIKGSCSILILHKDGIYIARDKLGYSPLIIGKSNKGWAVTTETSAFFNLGFSIERYVKPGEILLLKNTGFKVLKEGELHQKTDAFLWIYAGFPASNYEGINTEEVREHCGKFLAKRDNVEADLVAGVPDSGTTHAIGYSIESRIPFRRPLVKYNPGYGRSYIPPSQGIRDHIAKMKLIPIKEIIKGNRIILCEDSIVRGTQLKNYTVQKLWESGAKEIHVRAACPPLLFPSKFDYSTKKKEELIAIRTIKTLEGRDIKDMDEYIDSRSKKYKKMVDHIAKELDVTSLKYQTIEDMVKAIGLPKEKLCLYVWTGKV